MKTLVALLTIGFKYSIRLGFLIFLVTLVLFSGCSSIPKGLSTQQAKEIPTVMIANTDIYCNIIMHDINIKKGTIFKAEAIEEIGYNNMYYFDEFPPDSIYLNTDIFDFNLLHSNHGPVVFPNGEFVFEDAHYFVFNGMTGTYTHQPFSECKYDISPPFKLVYKATNR